MKEIYMIPDIKNPEKTMKISEKYNAYFEYNDFFVPNVYLNQEEVIKRIQIYKSLERDRSRDMLHGSFLDITLHSRDDEIRKISEKRIKQSLVIAEELGIRGVVFHPGLIPGFYAKSYLEDWLVSGIRFWKQMLGEFPSLEIYIENMFEARCHDLLRLACSMKEEPRFGICLDYSHYQVFGKDGKDWVKEFAPYVRHLHINDNNLIDDSHWEIGTGAINWTKYTEVMKKNRLDTSVLIETNCLDHFENSILYMQEKGIYPLENKKV